MKFSDWDEVVEGGSKEQIPAGEYICKIKYAETERNEKGIKVKLGLDIAEGKYANYFSEQNPSAGSLSKWSRNAVYERYIKKYDAAGVGRTQRFFKQLIKNIEDWNEGYKFNPADFDAEELVGKKCGFEFVEEEYENRQGQTKKKVRVRYDLKVEKFKTEEEDLPF